MVAKQAAWTIYKMYSAVVGRPLELSLDLPLELPCKVENSKNPRHVEAPLVMKSPLQITLRPTPNLG